MPTTTPLILASQSPRRRELLSQLEIPFQVIVADIDESQHSDEPPIEYARRLSRQKAQAVAQRTDAPVLILAADTIVVEAGDVLGKPRDTNEAAEMLRRLRGKTHTVYTAVTLLDTDSGRALTESPASPVTMRNYTDHEIADYIATGDPMDKAGGYAIQHAGFHPVEHLDSCYANVMGLPVCRVARLLQAFGIDLSPSAIDAVHDHAGHPCTLYDDPNIAQS